MDSNVTVVTYDVSDAMYKLEQLDKAVEKSADTAETSFKKAGDASKGFEKLLGGAGAGLGRLAAIGGTLGAATVGIVGAARGASLLGEQVARIAVGWESANENIEDYLRLSRDLQDITKGGGEIKRAEIEGETQRRLREIREEQNPIRREQIEVQAAQRAARGSLKVYENYYRDLERVAKESASKREQLETKLNSTVARINERRLLSSISGGSQGFQVGKLIEEADKLRGAGKTDEAESLLERALERAEGNRGAVAQVEQAFDRLVETMGKGVKAAKDTENADRNRAAAAKANVDALTQEIALLTERNALLAAAVKEKRADAVDVRNQGQREVLTEQLDTNTDVFGRQFDSVSNAIDNGRGKLELFKDAFNGLFTGDIFNLGFGDRVVAQTKTLGEGLRLAESIRTKIGGDPSKVGEQTRSIQTLAEVVAQLEGDDTLSDSLVPDVERLRTVLNLYKELQRTAAEVARAQSGLAEVPDTGSIRPTARPALPTGNTGTARPSTTTRNNNVTVNATVKGGLIDGETARQITDLIRREVRKGLSEGAN